MGKLRTVKRGREEALKAQKTLLLHLAKIGNDERERDHDQETKMAIGITQKTNEAFRLDLDDPNPIGSHFDYKDSDGKWWRLFPDRTKEAK